MEALEPKVQESIKKMSTARLIAKLVVAGYAEGDIEQLTREEMIETYAFYCGGW
jgi:hypothetical protein